MAKAILFDGSTVNFGYSDIETISVEPGSEDTVYSFLIKWKDGNVERAESLYI